ncbi:hypothetical protein [Zooshikella ganghwensis]|uniref:Uncharacterized protein n=1 Tax=Zooshikella ganghwensis TaxID=202772 RepID=A0A4V1IN20_9GAMM|nr:hypothetical protein [Zooshikella ganghwensis]RDH42201.1 hypothetical protein B9G39_01375 [Zooshikella ganghwensis]
MAKVEIYAETNKYNSYIVKDSNIIVGSNVTSYKVSDSYIIGYREKTDWKDSFTDSGNYGYFILNKKNAALIEGLNKDDLNNEINEINLNIKIDF